jgi:hypothetical protein
MRAQVTTDVLDPEDLTGQRLGEFDVDDLARCLPLRFDEASGGLVDQTPCARK